MPALTLHGGQSSVVGKILEIHQEAPGRIHVVLIRQVVGATVLEIEGWSFG